MKASKVMLIEFLALVYKCNFSFVVGVLVINSFMKIIHVVKSYSLNLELFCNEFFIIYELT